MCNHRLALGCGEKVAAQSHQAPCRNVEFKVGAVSPVLHMDESSLSAGGNLYCLAHELLRNIYGKVLYRLAPLAVDGLVQNFGLSHLKFETFATHSLDEHRKMQHSSSIYYKGIGIRTRFHSERKILLEFLLQTLLQMAGSDKLALTAEERRVVDAEKHAHSRLVHCNRRQRFRVLEVGYGISDFESVYAHDSADVPALHAFNLGLAQAGKTHQVLDFLFLDDVVSLAEAYVHSGLEFSPGDPSDGNTSHIRGIFQGGDEQLRSTLNHLRSRNSLQNGVQQSCDVSCRLPPVEGHPTLFCTSVNGLEVELVIGGVERAHKIEDLFLHFVRTAIELVHLVDYHHRLLAHLDGFLEHKPGLRHTALECVHKQEHPVGHIQHPFHLTTEVTVARGVDYIDFDILIYD